MNKLIISLTFTITLPLFQVAVAQEIEITETFLDSEITELQQNVCNNPEVDSILLSNQPDKTVLDDALVVNSTGDYNILTKTSYEDSLLSSNTLSTTTTKTDDFELEDDGVTVKVVDKTTVDTTIMADPADPSTQEELTTNICL